MKTTIMILIFSLTTVAAEAQKSDLLIKMADNKSFSSLAMDLNEKGTKAENLGDGWVRVRGDSKSLWIQNLSKNSNVEYVQPNYRIRLLENYKLQDPLRRTAVARFVHGNPELMMKTVPADNPPIPLVAPTQGTGADPKFSSQWGMNDIGVKDAWKKASGQGIIVAVIDTGVDYTHEDLSPNLWRNPGESGQDSQGHDKGTNGIDDDNNGFVDDVVGWDFVSNDNKPFDLAVEPLQLLAGGGNPGHGTHCAGNVGAKADNGLGVAGVAPNVKIMALRFISDKGEGTTAEAIKAIHYAVDNGAKVLSNSWGSEGEDDSQGAENKALRDAVKYAQDKNVLFVAAAGNGHKGVGYSNDSDPKPSYPATYDFDNIVSVAAIDSNNQLGAFSNWGPKTVHLAAPGVAVFSTTVGGNYSDTVIDEYGFHVTWDGTSMACPHVAGAAAVYWSMHPEKSYKDVKDALIKSAKKIPSLAGKVVSEGKLDVKNLVEM
jgi:thermitase